MIDMCSAIINYGTYWVQVFDRDFVKYDNDIFVVRHNRNFQPRFEETEYYLVSITKNSSFPIFDNFPKLSVVGNVFNGPYEAKMENYLHLIKEHVIRSFNLIDLEWEDDNKPVAEKKRIKISNNKKIRAFQFTSIPEATAKWLHDRNKLNLGVCCPICGLMPFTSDNNWIFKWEWPNGVGLNICEECYNKNK